MDDESGEFMEKAELVSVGRSEYKCVHTNAVVALRSNWSQPRRIESLHGHSVQKCGQLGWGRVR